MRTFSALTEGTFCKPGLYSPTHSRNGQKELDLTVGTTGCPSSKEGGHTLASTCQDGDAKVAGAIILYERTWPNIVPRKGKWAPCPRISSTHIHGIFFPQKGHTFATLKNNQWNKSETQAAFITRM